MPDSLKKLDALAREAHGALNAHARRMMRGAAVADDIAQESWLRVTAEVAEGGGTINNIRSYLFRVARNLMIDHRRREARGVEQWLPEEAIARIPDPQPSIEAQLITRDELRRMDAIIAAMPPRPREVFRLSRFEGLSFAEIGRRLGVSRQTVHDHMTRALIVLQMAAAADYDSRA
jgi:RNA polymerase sigma-70 factor (ECF subfamily)